MDFELTSSRTLKLFVDGKNKNGNETCISLVKKDEPFPSKIEWDIHNNAINRIALRLEMEDKNGKPLCGFWMTIRPLTVNNVMINYIPKETERIRLICLKENVIGKTAVLTITDK